MDKPKSFLCGYFCKVQPSSNSFISIQNCWHPKQDMQISVTSKLPQYAVNKYTKPYSQDLETDLMEEERQVFDLKGTAIYQENKREIPKVKQVVILQQGSSRKDGNSRSLFKRDSLKEAGNYCIPCSHFPWRFSGYVYALGEKQ